MGSVKEYNINQITLKMIDNVKWDFSEIESKNSEIKNYLKDIIKNEGVVYSLNKKKVFKAIYVFKMEKVDDKKSLVFDKKISLKELTAEVIEEFEKDIVTILGEEVASNEFEKATWDDKVIEPNTIKIGKWEIPVTLAWVLLGVVCCILFDEVIMLPIFLCCGIGTGYVVKANEPMRKLKKNKKKTKKKKSE